MLKNHLLPAFGNKQLNAILRTDVQLLHTTTRLRGAAPSSANRLLILTRYIFNLALRWEVPGLTVNPCKAIPLLQENNKRERFLSAPEVRSLIHEVRSSPYAMLQFIVSMLILTGARKREVLDARWSDFDLDRRLWRIPISKSGKSRHVPLSEAAAKLLHDLSHNKSSEWVFANPDTGTPFVSIYYSWNTCRLRANLPDIRMHDLRHSFASMLVNAGRTLYEVQQILGHRNVRTTERYAHLSPSTLRDAANAAARSFE
ncbi:MAG: hypothetical protein RLZZ227_2146 [Pseudomonadota bacterium]